MGGFGPEQCSDGRAMRSPRIAARHGSTLGALAEAAVAAAATEANVGKKGTAPRRRIITTGKENGSDPAAAAKPQPPVTAKQRKALGAADKEAVDEAVSGRYRLSRAVTWLYEHPKATADSYRIAHGNVPIEEAGPLARRLPKGLSTIPGVSYSLERAVLVRPLNRLLLLVVCSLHLDAAAADAPQGWRLKSPARSRAGRLRDSPARAQAPLHHGGGA